MFHKRCVKKNCVGTRKIFGDLKTWFWYNLLTNEFLICRMFQTAPEVGITIFFKYTGNLEKVFDKINLFYIFPKPCPRVFWKGIPIIKNMLFTKSFTKSVFLTVLWVIHLTPITDPPSSIIHYAFYHGS